jgi:hypothetical protein
MVVLKTRPHTPVVVMSSLTFRAKQKATAVPIKTQIITSCYIQQSHKFVSLAVFI